VLLDLGDGCSPARWIAGIRDWFSGHVLYRCHQWTVKRAPTSGRSLCKSYKNGAESGSILYPRMTKFVN
jgi:hypothetical protein